MSSWSLSNVWLGICQGTRIQLSFRPSRHHGNHDALATATRKVLAADFTCSSRLPLWARLAKDWRTRNVFVGWRVALLIVIQNHELNRYRKTFAQAATCGAHQESQARINISNQRLRSNHCKETFGCHFGAVVSSSSMCHDRHFQSVDFPSQVSAKLKQITTGG